MLPKEGQPARQRKQNEEKLWDAVMERRREAEKRTEGCMHVCVCVMARQGRKSHQTGMMEQEIRSQGAGTCRRQHKNRMEKAHGHPWPAMLIARRTLCLVPEIGSRKICFASCSSMGGRGREEYRGGTSSHSGRSASPPGEAVLCMAVEPRNGAPPLEQRRVSHPLHGRPTR